jgi:hypothetical protein
MAWPPSVGEPLSRGADAWFERPKWSEWILSERGHGPEWRAILRVSSQDTEALWEAISAVVVKAPVHGVRVAPGGGMLCEVRFELPLHGRVALAITIWHLAVRARRRGA